MVELEMPREAFEKSFKRAIESVFLYKSIGYTDEQAVQRVLEMYSDFYEFLYTWEQYKKDADDFFEEVKSE